MVEGIKDGYLRQLTKDARFVSGAISTETTNVSGLRGGRGSYNQTHKLLQNRRSSSSVCKETRGTNIYRLLPKTYRHSGSPAVASNSFHSSVLAWVKYHSNYKTQDAGELGFRNGSSKLLPFFSSQ